MGLYDPNPAVGARPPPRFVDPSLRPRIGERYRGLCVETDLAALIDHHALDLALITLPDRYAPAAIVQLARSGIHSVVDKPAALDAAAAREKPVSGLLRERLAGRHRVAGRACCCRRGGARNSHFWRGLLRGVYGGCERTGQPDL